MSRLERSFYQELPEPRHAPGDIWSNMPTHGLLRCARTSALVITPSCDLAQTKAETITYLPILPVRAWFATPAFLPELRRILDDSLKYLKVSPGALWDVRYFLPSTGSVREASAHLQERRAAGGSRADEDVHFGRCEAALDHLARMHNPLSAPPPSETTAVLLGARRHRELLGKLLRNANLDTHFLPTHAIDQWAAVREPSLVLFRYPLTAPIEILEWAQDPTLADWSSACRELEPTQPFASCFHAARPLKTARLVVHHLADLLTRFTSLYSRVGSPDLSPHQLDTLLSELTEP